MSQTTLSPLACDIRDLAEASGSIETEIARERLTVASKKRFSAAVRELLAAKAVENTGGCIRIPGDRTPRPGTVIAVKRLRRDARRAEQGVAA